MNSNLYSKRLLWLVLLGVCLAGGGFFANHVLQRRNDFYQRLAYQTEVMSDLQPVAADPWQDGSNPHPDSPTSPAPVFETQVAASNFLRAVKGELTVATPSSLQAAVTQEFEAKQKLQEAQVHLLEQRVRELRRILEHRRSNRATIIANRIREMKGIEATATTLGAQPNFSPQQPRLRTPGPSSGNLGVLSSENVRSSENVLSSENARSLAPHNHDDAASGTQPTLPATANALLSQNIPHEEHFPPLSGNAQTTADEAVNPAAATTNFLSGASGRVWTRGNESLGFLTPSNPLPESDPRIREIDFGPQSRMMRAVALGMFRGEKGVFLSADEETFVLQASSSQQERFAAVAHEIFTSPYVTPDRLGAHLKDLEVKSERMRSLIDTKENAPQFVKEGRKKLEDSMRRNEDLIAAFKAIIENEKASWGTVETEQGNYSIVEESADAEAVFEEVSEGVSEPSRENADNYDSLEESTLAEPVESFDLPKVFSRGAETQPVEESSEPAEADSFGLAPESR